MIMLQTNKTAPILKLSTKTNAYLNSSVTLSGSGRGRSPFYMFSRSKSFLESRTAMTKSNVCGDLDIGPPYSVTIDYVYVFVYNYVHEWCVLAQ